MNEYPKFLSRSGWADLADSVVVHDAGEEAAARAGGYRMLSEPKNEPAFVPPVIRRGRPRKVAE